jgi:hypothetical protein
VCELFPTEVRATAAAFVGFVYIAAGSLGLGIVGALAAPGWVDPSVTVAAIAVACGVSVVALRRLPETAGADVT